MKFDIFKAGKIYNPLKGQIKKPILKYKNIEIKVPARLNTMCFDIKTLVKPKQKNKYSAGELAFSVDINTYTKLKVIPNKKKQIIISNNTKRKALVKHAALIMQKTLKLKDSLQIEANNEKDFPHAGFGSSSSLITSVIIAINEAYSKPMNKRQMTLLIAENHGEEIKEEEDKLIHIQCNGGSPSVALYPGGMQIIVGETDEICLRRELKEEIGVELVSYKFYKEYNRKSFYHDYMLKSRMYLVSIKGEPKENMEIKRFCWLSKEEFEKQQFLIIPIINEELIPDLIKDKILL